jgi:predicted transposase YdaD
VQVKRTGKQAGIQAGKQEGIQALADLLRSGKTLEEAIRILGVDSADRPHAKSL